MHSFYKISAAMLMGFGPHFGSLFLTDWNADSSGFIHSRFHSRFLINLAFTSAGVTKAIKFINFFVSRHLKFLYSSSEGFLRSIRKSVQSTQFWRFNFFLVNSWIPGTLTNYKVVRFHLSKLQRRTNLIQCPSGLIFLGDFRSLPIASSEARASKFPSIGLADIDNGFSPFTYTIPSNNKAFGVSNAYYHLFWCAAEYGRALGYEFHRDRVSPKFDSAAEQIGYLFRSQAPSAPRIRVWVTSSPNYSIRSKPYRQWWLTSLNKLPLKVFGYRIDDDSTILRSHRRNRLWDLCIDISMSIQLDSSNEFLEYVNIIDTRLRELGSYRYLRYLNRKWRRRLQRSIRTLR